MGRQTNAVDAAGVTTFRYDDYGSLTNETVVGAAGENTIVRHWDSYDRTAGYSLVGRAVPNAPQRQTTIGYDSATGRIATMLGNGSNVPFVWSYLPGSDLKSSLSYPNGLVASWQYDANDQLLQVCNATPTNVILQYDYTYDAAGRRIEIARFGSVMSESRTDSYGYNIRNELTSPSKLGGTMPEYAYQYDDIGNRITSTDLGTNRTYTANSLNQYSSISKLCDSASLREEFVPQFDDDGNQTLIQTATGIWKVTYNGENRPMLWERIASNSSTPNSSNPTLVSMSFDRMGRRVQYFETCGTTTSSNSTFTYDGYLQVANLDTATQNTQHFAWDPTEPIATRPLVWSFSTLQPFNHSTSYYTHDGNKNISEVVLESREVYAYYEFAPFGVLAIPYSASVVSNSCRFSSEYVDETLGIVYYIHRHYEPSTGKWYTRDAYEGVHEYSYCENNPVCCFDYLGNSKTQNNVNNGGRANIFSALEPLDSDIGILQRLVMAEVALPGQWKKKNISYGDAKNAVNALLWCLCNRKEMKINRTETNVVWVCDFPLAGESTKFTVHEDPVRKRMLITETGDMCQDGCTQLAGDRFEVSVNVSENLVKHYIHRTYNPVECYPFLEEAVKKVFGPRSEFCLVAPMLKTDSSVMIYTCNGGFWNLTLPLVTDIENIKCFCEYPAMFVVAVESFPLDDFWESVNLSTDEAKYWHSYFLKLFELGFLKCSFIYMK